MVSGRLYGDGWPVVLRPVQYTVAPASPSIRAIPRPAPRVAPATTATRPSSDFMASPPSEAVILPGDCPALQEPIALQCARDPAQGPRGVRHRHGGDDDGCGLAAVWAAR